MTGGNEDLVNDDVTPIGDPAITLRITDADRRRLLEQDVRRGLTDAHKSLPAKWLYDARGGELFGQITQLPEYYPTRTEAALLAAIGPQLAAAAPAHAIVELGAGDSPKTRQLVDACAAGGTLERFVSFDVDEESLRRSTRELAARHPGVRVEGMLADMTSDLDLLPGGEGVLVALLGSTIGNFLHDQRVGFYRDVAERLQPGSWLLVGYDLVKDPAVLEAAYDDSAGVTAAFTRNVLVMLNRELDGNFDVDGFAHDARWLADEQLVRVGLRARGKQRARLDALDLDVSFADGELLHLEVCCKFLRNGVEGELAESGFAIDGWWTDPSELFALCLARRV